MNDMRTVRGMRDLLGEEMIVRNYLVEEATRVFTNFGYQPLDSPVMELWETLSAKGGEEIEDETFKFKDKGEREVGLRFDLTVPLARIVASNPHLKKPFKRYAIGKAWRYDRPQAGRYREFMQADVDIIGSKSPVADAEVVLIALEFLRRTLEEKYLIRINNRKILRGLTELAGVEDSLAYECFRSIDKLDKIGKDGVIEELSTRGISSSSTEMLLDALDIRGSGRDSLDDFSELLKKSSIGMKGVEELALMADIFEQTEVSKKVLFDMSLARGFDYYTGPVFEGRYLGEPKVGSILGGGRYDRLIGRFGGIDTPATGISLGIDRIIDIVMSRGIPEGIKRRIDVFVAPIKKSPISTAMMLTNKLAMNDIAVEMDLMGRNLGKMLEQAEYRGAQYTVIIGPKDMKKGEVSVRDMTSKETHQVKMADALSYIQKNLQ